MQLHTKPQVCFGLQQKPMEDGGCTFEKSPQKGREGKEWELSCPASVVWLLCNPFWEESLLFVFALRLWRMLCQTGGHEVNI